MDQVQRFLHHSDYTPQTRKRYKYILTKLKGWLDENKLEIKNVGIDQYLNYVESHRWSQNTQRLHINAARSYVRWKYGDHPLLSFSLPRADTKPGRSLTDNKLQALLASFDTGCAKGCRDLAIFSLLAETGIRANEAATLEMNYLYLEENRLKVLAKRRRWQTKIISSDTAQVMSMWLAWRSEAADPGVQEVFVSLGGNTPGQGLTKYGVQSIFRYKSREIGYKISPHDLRRTFATLFIERGAPTRVVQELGGWSSLREVERYTRNLKVEDVERYSPIVRRINLSQDNRT